MPLDCWCSKEHYCLQIAMYMFETGEELKGEEET